MSVFHYRAFDGAGKAVMGAQEADSILTLETRLKAAGIWLLEAKEGTAVIEEIARGGRSTKVNRSELIAFFVQMALLLKAGVTLPTALKRLGEDNAGTRLGELLEGLREQVAIGEPLNEAMNNYPKVFSRQITAMIKAGEASGRVPEVFDSLSSYYEWLDQLTSEIRQALIYPVMVLGASMSLVLLLFTFVVPRFVTLLTELHLKIPVLTQIVMWLSQALLRSWPVLIGALVILPVAWKFAMRIPAVARAFDSAMMSIPIFGPLLAMFSLSRFSNNLAMLYRAGIPLVRGIEICRQLVGNRAIEAAVEHVRLGVLEGTPLHRCMAQHRVFPRTMITMIATGETSGSLDVALQSVSDYYNKIIPRRIKIVFAIFDPVMMISLIAIVGVVALSVILPILQLWDAK
ncbi:MAG: type II secretion system F family protein [Opitutus sp.]